MGTSVESSKHQSERTCQSFDVHFALTSFNSPARNPWPEKSFRRRRSTRRQRQNRHRRWPTTTQLQRPRVVRRSRLGPFNSVCKGQTRAAGFELSRLAVKLTRCWSVTFHTTVTFSPKANYSTETSVTRVTTVTANATATMLQLFLQWQLARTKTASEVNGAKLPQLEADLIPTYLAYLSHLQSRFYRVIYALILTVTQYEGPQATNKKHFTYFLKLFYTKLVLQ